MLVQPDSCPHASIHSSAVAHPTRSENKMNKILMNLCIAHFTGKHYHNITLDLNKKSLIKWGLCAQFQRVDKKQNSKLFMGSMWKKVEESAI